MKVVKRSPEYTIYQKRSERYAVRKADKSYINGDEKTKILLEAGLIKAVLPKPPEPETEPEPEPEAETEAEAEAAAEEATEAEAEAGGKDSTEEAPEGE